MKSIIIHVNRQHIAQNLKDDGNKPVYTIKFPEGNIKYAREVIIDGPSRMVYDKTGLKCGAKAWVETQGPITLIDEMTYEETKILH